MVGMRVDVYFTGTTTPDLLDVVVEYQPCDVGDSWRLRSSDGRVHRVILFERMSQRAAAEAGEGANTLQQAEECQPGGA